MSEQERETIEHRQVRVAGGEVHVAAAGSGPPVLLVHGFPETWRVFRPLMAHLAGRHRVLAVDLPGFGDSPAAEVGGSERAAAALVEVIESLGLGSVHVLGQDISGALTYRIAATRPDLVASWTAVETLLPGFGFEALADVAHGGAWYIGMLCAPGAPELLLPGREREFIVEQAMAPQVRAAGIPDAELAVELTRSYARPDGFSAAAALYRSLLAEGDDIRLLAARPLELPVLAVGGSAGRGVADLLRPVAPHLEGATIADVGHYVALEAPDRLAATMLPFLAAHEAVTR